MSSSRFLATVMQIPRVFELGIGTLEMPCKDKVEVDLVADTPKIQLFKLGYPR